MKLVRMKLSKMCCFVSWLIPEAACSASLSRTCFEADGLQSSSSQARCACCCYAEAELLKLCFLEAVAEQGCVWNLF